jgi:four helix bundle protein
LNIAEGNGRLGRNEQRQFYAVSHGSLFKCVAILDICKDRAWVPEKDFLELESEAREILAMINGLIDYVRSKS